MVLICPTFVHNKTYDRFVDHDSRIFVTGCQQEEVGLWLKLSSHSFQGMNTLIILDNCATSKDVKGRTGQLASLGFLARNGGISIWVLTQQITSIAKSFRENVATTVLLYNPLGKTMTDIFEDYIGELCPQEHKELMAELKKEKFYLSVIRPMPSIQNQNSQLIYTACLNKRSSTKSCKCWTPLQTARNPCCFAPCQQRSRTTQKAGCVCFHR